jgi:hypothetical protein
MAKTSEKPADKPAESPKAPETPKEQENPKAKPSGAKKFVANWRIEGVTKNPLEAGDSVELSDDDAKDLVAVGALSPARTRSEQKSEGGE